MRRKTNGLCQWPKDGYKVYKYVSTSQSGNTATIVLADEAGKQYTITVVEGVPNGLTVKDENGNVIGYVNGVVAFERVPRLGA